MKRSRKSESLNVMRERKDSVLSGPRITHRALLSRRRDTLQVEGSKLRRLRALLPLHRMGRVGVRIPRNLEHMNYPLTRPGGHPLPRRGGEGWGEGAKVHGEGKCRATIHEVQAAECHEDPSPWPSPS